MSVFSELRSAVMDFEVTNIAPGISVPLAVADFIFSHTEWVANGSLGEFTGPVPEGYDRSDLLTLSFLVANGEFSRAEKLVNTFPPPPMEMRPSATLMDEEEGMNNQNYLKQNPFGSRRRRNEKRRRKAVMGVATGNNAGPEDANTEVGLNTGFFSSLVPP